MTEPIPPSREPDDSVPQELETGMSAGQASSGNDSWLPAFRNALVLILIITTVGTGGLSYISKNLPSLRQLQDFSPNVATKIISRDGKEIGELFTERRVLIPLRDMPVDLRHALIAMEDTRFYDHWGVSLCDFARAVVVNIGTLSYSQGFSSLTQQLARNLYDVIGSKKTLIRKLKEILIAVQIERTYTKNEIMEMYLNSVHFGHGTYGIQAAATSIFGVDARDLNLEQCAMLVGVLPTPARYSPRTHPDRAFRRRNIVLASMLKHGYVDQYEYERLRYKPISATRRMAASGFAPYFAEQVRRQMELEDERLGINLYRDGLEIRTTLDSRMQSIATRIFMEEINNNQRVLNEALLANDSLIFSMIDSLIFPLDSVRAMIEGDIPIAKELKDKLLVQGAFVLLENDTGNILALIGGRTDYPDYWNRVTQALRQPGSTFKPLLYMTAIDQGYPVSTRLLNQPLPLTDDALADADTALYDPRNDDGSTSGLVSLRDGLRRSLNIVSARIIIELVTPRQVVDMAKRFQITSPLRPVRSIALGTSEVYLLELTASYAAMANNGVYVQPIAVTEIRDRRGKVLREYIPERKEVIEAEKAYLLLDLMQGVMINGTGARSRWMYGFTRPAAGKSGTTDKFTDAWFIGFTPQLSAGVWVGVDDPQVSLGEKRYGNVAALPIWARIMKEIHDTFELPKLNWEMPEGVVRFDICALTGDRPTEYCPRERELFLLGTEPSITCQVHTGFDFQVYDADDDAFLR